MCEFIYIRRKGVISLRTFTLGVILNVIKGIALDKCKLKRKGNILYFNS